MHIKMHTSPVIEECIKDLSRYSEARIPNKLRQCYDNLSNSNLGSLYDICGEFLVYSLLSGVYKSEAINAALQLMLQSDLLQYLSQFDTPIPASPRLGNKTVSVRRDYCMSAAGWSDEFIQIRLFYWQFICRSEGIRTILLANDFSPMFKGNGSGAEYLSALYSFLRYIIQDEWEEAFEFYNSSLLPAFLNLAPVDQVNPGFFLPLWKTLLEDDVQTFNMKLEESISEFREFRGTPTDSDPYRHNDISGHFSLELTALIKLASVKKYEISVSSDYTPYFFMVKDFELDIDTSLDWYFTPVKKEYELVDIEALYRENLEEQEKENS